MIMFPSFFFSKEYTVLIEEHLSFETQFKNMFKKSL